MCREAEKPAEKLRVGRKRGQGSRRERSLKRQGNGDVPNGERVHLGGCFWVWRRLHSRGLEILVRGTWLGVRKGRARWKGVRLGGKKEFFEKREALFAQKSHEVLGREKER